MNHTLEARYRDDPALLRFYKKKLLLAGWAGQMDAVEREYVRRQRARLGRRPRGKPFPARKPSPVAA